MQQHVSMRGAMPHDTLIFRPPLWRVLIAYLASYGRVILLLLLYTRWQLTGGMGGVILGGFLATLCTLPRRQRAFTITIAHTSVAGPAGWCNRQAAFSLALLDPRRTGQQSLLQRLLCRRYIYATDGTQIRLYAWAFGSRRTQAILHALHERAALYTRRERG
jgi:hypothetical protein